MSDAIFKDHPKAMSYHKTSDGNAFFRISDANNHAKTLEDKKVVEVKNPDFLEVASETVVGSDSVTDAEKTVKPVVNKTAKATANRNVAKGTNNAKKAVVAKKEGQTPESSSEEKVTDSNPENKA